MQLNHFEDTRLGWGNTERKRFGFINKARDWQEIKMGMDCHERTSTVNK